MITHADQLRTLHCARAKDPLDAAEAARLLSLLDGWAIDAGRLTRAYGFKDYYQTMAFVNAIAYIAHCEDHHPELVVGYKNCVVRFDTHSVKGLSLNDFICAAKADVLVRVAGCP
ncbi:4a-hydroxytetrahydrobiopterin dehydratase [Pseudoduganella umbonata]|uniref:Putative pterin-4-alpha-carbinolamine dehydratase n=1 Tax=Pseudoduganella umbonata TaxID=864828 RepID=A0A4P8HVA4_9BURK|nr:4a-hydroxytetrahydrobiopterin dehydratase [Pseudoduganella umbonata]MBB3224183.1 4a-hydroxytetrahydrobiopterin dehydratase [Pseudoduganella umbonata]QCP13957.1 4a-hydroxytetrahydrobiopterin dehydratase [Pseudoduganella umbonata]